MTWEITTYDKASRRVLKSYRVTNPEHADWVCGDGQECVMGRYRPRLDYIDRGGAARPVSDGGPDDPGPEDVAVPEPVVIRAAEVDAETGRRITARFDHFAQLNAATGVRDDVDFDWIKSVRAAGKTLKAMDPIPPDYADDKHWPSNT